MMDGYAMRDYRKSVGLTQEEVAADLEVDKQTVNRWERGKTRIKASIEGAFITLMCDSERVSWIKDHRDKKVRGRPFLKKSY